MKITLAYIPEEEQDATADLAALVNLHPAAKVRKSNHHPPFKHIYLSISPPPTLDRGQSEEYNKINKSTAPWG